MFGICVLRGPHSIFCKNLNEYFKWVISPENPGQLFFLINEDMGQLWAFILQGTHELRLRVPMAAPSLGPLSQLDKTHRSIVRTHISIASSPR